MHTMAELGRLRTIHNPRAKAYVNGLCYISRRYPAGARLATSPPRVAASSVNETVGSSVETIDAFAQSLMGALLDESGDAAGVLMPKRGQRRSEGERLAAQCIAMALLDAERKAPKLRDDARDWLQDAASLFSARVCFESLGLDYDAVMTKIENRWRRIAAGETVPPLKLSRNLVRST
jgi:hypothetical protein